MKTGCANMNKLIDEIPAVNLEGSVINLQRLRMIRKKILSITNVEGS